MELENTSVQEIKNEKKKIFDTLRTRWLVDVNSEIEFNEIMPLVMIFSQIVSGNHVISQFPLAKSILLGKKEIYFFIFYVGWEKTNLQKKQTKPVKVLQPQLPSPQKKHKKQKKNTQNTHKKRK